MYVYTIVCPYHQHTRVLPAAVVAHRSLMDSFWARAGGGAEEEMVAAVAESGRCLVAAMVTRGLFSATASSSSSSSSPSLSCLFLSCLFQGGVLWRAREIL